MADEADLSDSAPQAEIDTAVAAARTARRQLVPCGVCNWCGSPVISSRIFCAPEDNACAKDWEDHQQVLKNQRG